ncbi:MAG: DUF2273 domain-containing protein [Ruminococcaceae bacterium]|nr:DUF2273 domain-containing protein [Oscillospiraceae bacterium]
MNFITKLLPPQLQPYAGRLVLTALGLVISILFLTLGFWPTLLLIILCGGGYALGTWLDRRSTQSQNPYQNYYR